MNTEQYFYRNVMFSKSGNQISIIDIQNPEKNRQVLESWFGNIFLLADGQHSIDELTSYISQQYKGSPPGNLKETITSVIQRMTDSKLIVLAQDKVKLPYYLSMPYELLDIEKAKKLIEEDQAKLN